MKILYIVYLLCVVALGGVAAQGSNYQGRMHVTPLMFEQRGDSLYIRINFDVSGVNVDAQKSISLVPALVSLERRLELPEVQVKGRNNYNVYKRELHLMNGRERARYNQSAPYSVLRGFNAQGAHRVDYSQVIRFEPWMAQAKLDIYEDLSGCGGARRRMGVSMLVNQVLLEKIIEPYSVTAFLAYIQPVAEQVKRREIVSEAFLDFVVNQTNIRPEYLNNPRELRKITELITRVRDDGDVMVRSIKVIGFASPEGTLANNERLCEGRARALVDYLSGRFDYPRSMYKVVFGGENWQGLAEMVENSQMPHRQAVLDIIETVPAQIDYRNDMSRKKALMNLRGGDPYRYMLREFFPYLRKAICKIEFEVRNFDIFRAKEVIRSRPENLSLDEMFMVANSYESGSREFVDVFETAVRVYPDDPTANINAAAAALSRSDLVYAQRYLDRIKSGSVESAEYYNVVGALAMLRGDYDRADMYLSRAASMGLKEARRNLAELAKKRENIKQIEEKKTDKQLTTKKKQKK